MVGLSKQNSSFTGLAPLLSNVEHRLTPDKQPVYIGVAVFTF